MNVNHPPFVKEDPTKCPDRRPQHFKATELEELFGGEITDLSEYRVTRCARALEDMLQLRINHLPFGIRLHRRVGAGARKHRDDGKPGFVSRCGITTYNICNIEYDDKGRIVSLYGIGRHGQVTKAWVWQ